MRSSLAICLILVFFVDQTYGTFTEFVNKFPLEVAKVFSNAWTSFTEVVKRPGQHYRHRQEMKAMKATTVIRSISEKPLDKKKKSHLWRGASQARGGKLIIPLLTPMLMVTNERDTSPMTVNI